MQTPHREPDAPWNRPPALALPSSLRAFATDELMRAMLVLLIAVFVGLIILDRVVTHLAPDGIPAAGIPHPSRMSSPPFRIFPLACRRMPSH